MVIYIYNIQNDHRDMIRNTTFFWPKIFSCNIFLLFFILIKIATVELEPADQLSLIIRNVNRETIGRFFCMAKNDKGETQSNLIILDVQCKSKRIFNRFLV